jgi:hypothetical protein
VFVKEGWFFYALLPLCTAPSDASSPNKIAVKEGDPNGIPSGPGFTSLSRVSGFTIIYGKNKSNHHESCISIRYPTSG